MKTSEEIIKEFYTILGETEKLSYLHDMVSRGFMDKSLFSSLVENMLSGEYLSGMNDQREEYGNENS